MKYLYILLFILPIEIYSQISIEPNVNLTLVWLSVEDSPEGINIGLENKYGRQRGLGFSINAKLTDKFTLSIQTQYSQMVHRGKYIHLDFMGHTTFDPPGPAVSRWDNAAYFSFSPLKNIDVGLGGHAIYQPVFGGSFFGFQSAAYKTTEYGLGIRVKCLIKIISVSLEYYHGLGYSDSRLYFYDPFRTLGLKVGYPIQLKRK